MLTPLFLLGLFFLIGNWLILRENIKRKRGFSGIFGPLVSICISVAIIRLSFQ